MNQPTSRQHARGAGALAAQRDVDERRRHVSRVTRVSASPRDVAERVRVALESQNPDSFADLLAPDVRWGPSGDDHRGCHNRDEVLAWHRAGRERGTARGSSSSTLSWSSS